MGSDPHVGSDPIACFAQPLLSALARTLRTPEHQGMDLQARLNLQDGLITRTQAFASGLTLADVRRLLRRREWVAVHPGVYINHTGKLTWRERAWAAVLVAGPGAALCLDSALRAHEGAGRKAGNDALIHVAVVHGRPRLAPDGVRIHQMVDLSSRVQWNKTPPSTRYDDTILDLASRAGPLDSVARLADACGSRRTTAARLRDRLDQRKRIAQRDWLRSVLSDVADGTCSVLEHGYLDLVERPHGLPVGQRQALRDLGNGRIYRDVDLPELDIRIELDGKLFHTSTEDRDRDLERDLDAVVAEDGTTIRLGFGQVHERPCSTAAKLAKIAQRRGWDGEPTTCAECRAAA